MKLAIELSFPRPRTSHTWWALTQSVTFFEEHAALGAQPEMAAFGSQSWASLDAQATLQSEAACLFGPSNTQHTELPGQLAAPLHLSAVAAAPPSSTGQLAPRTQR